MLKEEVERYIALRRSMGFKLKESAMLLAKYADFAEAQGEQYVRAQTAIAWAAEASTPDMRYRRIADVTRLAHHLRAEDIRHEIPPEGVFTSHRTKFVPYIFTADELARFIDAAYEVQKDEVLPVRREIYAVLFGLISVTGLRISEALELRLPDVRPDGVLLIRKTKFAKSRMIPLHPSVSTVLGQYLNLRRDIVSEDDHLFLSEGKRKIYYSVVNRAFHEILNQARIAPDRKRRPRIHDLRHTFATRVLEQCGAGQDVIARRAVALGPVDGFDQDEGSGKCDERAEVCGGLFAAQGDAFEAFELADGLLDAGPSPVEGPCEPLWAVFGVLPVGNDGQGALSPSALAIFGAVIGLVGDDDAGPDIGAEVQQGLEMRAVRRLAAGQVEGDRQAVEIRLQVDFGAETAP